ncbi:selenocysteine protein [Candidatus Magnetomorum sp. HK-1]|nr:selenocysteine protein [Candidatus Magnetomorum sp. HK-1]
MQRLTYEIPKDKTAFEQLVQGIRENFSQSLTFKEQTLMERLPFPEGKIYRRMNTACPVLWVAPHGFFGDALHTDYVAMISAEMMAGSCLVNNKQYRCPVPETGYGEIANLNDPDDPGPSSLVFIKKLLSATSIIRLKTGEAPYIVFLLNLPESIGPSVEITFATSDEKHDAQSSEWITRLKESIVLNDYDITFLEKRLPVYERTLFSYFFQKQNEIGPLRLIQIRLNCNEILYPETIAAVSDFLSRALSYTTQSENSSKEVLLQEQEIGLNQTSEKEADMRLVEQAGMKLTEIISRHYENAMIEAGTYLVNIFFDNDIERARQKKPVKDKSLYQLILYLQKQKNNAPSKSWLYNAVNLAVDSYDFKRFQTYGKLMLSHKILLLPIDSSSIKKNLIQEIVEKNFTVSQLKDRITQIKNSPPPPESLPVERQKPQRKKTTKENNIPRLLKKSEKTGDLLSKKILNVVEQPEKLFNKDVSQHFNKKSLTDISSGKRRQILRKLKKKHTGILSDIQQLKTLIRDHENYLHQYQNLMVEMENTLKL